MKSKPAKHRMQSVKTFRRDIELFLQRAARWWRVTFDSIATRAAERFGDAAPSVDEIATFICQFLCGKMNVNRLHRDPAMAAFARRCRASGMTIDAMQAACVQQFGPDRTPSRTALARYFVLAAVPWQSAAAAAQRSEMDLWLKQAAPRMTLGALHTACAAKFGSNATHGRSAIHRRLQSLGLVTAGRNWRTAGDPELVAWLAAECHNGTLDECHAAGVARFGVDRMPSRSALHRCRRRQEDTATRAAKSVPGGSPC